MRSYRLLQSIALSIAVVPSLALAQAAPPAAATPPAAPETAPTPAPAANEPVTPEKAAAEAKARADAATAAAKEAVATATAATEEADAKAAAVPKTPAEEAKAKEAEAAAESAKDKEAEDSTFGNGGISQDPQWDILAGAAISTLDATQPQAGLGLQYSSNKRLLRVIVRKNLSGSSIEGSPGDAGFGHAALNPALGDFSAALRAELGIGPTWLTTKRIARYGFRLYSDFAVAKDKLVLNYTSDEGAKTTLSKLAVPLAVSGGAAFKIDGVMPGDRKFGGSQLLMIEVYGGPSLRVFGGDWNAAQRKLLWDKGHDGRNFFGAEVGAFLQFGSMLLEPKFTWLGVTDGNQPHGFRDSRVNGLTSCQFDMKIAFFVPWTVVGNETPSTYVAADQKKAADEQKKKKDQEQEAALSNLKAVQTDAETRSIKAQTEAAEKGATK